MHMHVEARDSCWGCLPLSLIRLVFWGKVSAKLKRTNSTRLTGQQAPGILLSGISNTGIIDVYHCTWLFMWALWIQTQVLMHGWQALYQLSISPVPEHYFLYSEKGCCSMCLFLLFDLFLLFCDRMSFSPR